MKSIDELERLLRRESGLTVKRTGRLLRVTTREHLFSTGEYLCIFLGPSGGVILEHRESLRARIEMGQRAPVYGLCISIGWVGACVMSVVGMLLGQLSWAGALFSAALASALATLALGSIANVFMASGARLIEQRKILETNVRRAMEP